MTLAISHLTTGSGTASPVSTGSVTVDPGEAIYVTLCGTQTGANATGPDMSVSGLSLTWTDITGKVVQTNNRRSSYVWRGLNSTGVQQSGALSITATGASGGTFQELTYIVDKAAGLDNTTPNGTPQGVYAGAVTSYTLPSVGTPDAGDVVHAGMTSPTSSTAAVYADGFTSLADVSSTNTRDTKTGYDASDPVDDTPTFTTGASVGVLAIGFIINVAPETRYARPDGDVMVNGWLPSDAGSPSVPLFSMIDEADASPEDADYIYTTAAGSIYEGSLTLVSTARGGKALQFRARGLQGETVRVSLVQAGSPTAVIMTRDVTLTTSFANYSLELSNAEIAAIVDPNTVNLRFESLAAGGAAPSIVQSTVEYVTVEPCTPTFASTPTVGNQVVVLVQWQSSTLGGVDPDTWTVSDNYGNTYTPKAVEYIGAGIVDGITCGAFVANVGSTGSGFTVTVSNSDPDTWAIVASLVEVSGEGTPVVNATGVFPDINDLPDTNHSLAITTSFDRCLVLALFGSWTGIGTAGGGYANVADATLSNVGDGIYHHVMSKQTSAAGSTPAQITYGSSTEYVWGVAVAIRGT